jgi:GT2 family glycosyltransferase
MVKKTQTGVTVLTPSFNCKANIFRLLDSLLASNYANLEVIIVDNGSLDGTIKEGKKKYPKVKWIDAGPINIGQTGAYNLGFAHANPNNHVMMIDADVVVDKNMLVHIVDRLESDPKIGVVTPMVLYLNDHNWVNQAGANVDLWTGRVTIGWGDKKNYQQAKIVQNSGTAMIFKRELVDKIGCFEDWFLCYFDPDYCLRALKAGYTTWYEPLGICYHDQSKDEDYWRPRVLTRAFLLGKNRTLFMRKHGKNIFVYCLSLLPLFGFYLVESLKYNVLQKWFELIAGTLVGFLSPVNKDLYIPLPKLAS